MERDEFEKLLGVDCSVKSSLTRPTASAEAQDEITPRGWLHLIRATKPTRY